MLTGGIPSGTSKSTKPPAFTCATPVAMDHASTVTVHWPDASVFPKWRPTRSTYPPHVPPKISPKSVKSVLDTIPTPSAGTNPAPSPRSFSTVTVNVCGWPTSFVPDVPIVIRASKSTYCFCALALSPGSPSPVVRVRTTPPTVTSVVAWIVFAPGALEVILTVHSPFGSTVVQLLGPTKVAEPVGIENVISVPGG